ncbi:MAG: helix-turn-helix domain-containing protein [Novosphingobium sp.]
MAERDIDFSELPLESAGALLRRAREEAGLSRSDISARTKIAERHLTSIEDGNYGALASRAYAIGFARSYARAIGLDEMEIAAHVREDLQSIEPQTERRATMAFEPGDPARVPTSRLAWLAALGALATMLVAAWFWRDYYMPGATLPDLAENESPAPASNEPQPPVAGAQAAQGPVVFTALEPGIWVRFYDASGTQLMQKLMEQGETYTVPADANGPMVRTARPDALQVTIDGRVVPKLSERQMIVSDLPVTAAALLARSADSPAAASPSPAAAPQPRASPAATIRVPLTERPREVRSSPSSAPRTAAANPQAVSASSPQPSTVSD